MFDLSGKKAMVTGAASGIGRASALALAKAGADVAIIDLNEKLGRQTSEEIKALGRKSMFFHQGRCVDSRTGCSHGPAGLGWTGRTAHRPQQCRHRCAPERIDRRQRPADLAADAVNLSGMFYCCREQARHMIPQRYGKIVNTGSMSGTIVNNFELGGAQVGGVGMIA